MIALSTLEQIHQRYRRQKTVVDASGKMVTPGFIDPHTHSLSEFKIRRIKTAISITSLKALLPSSTAMMAVVTPYVNALISELEGKGIGTNNGNFVGHGTVRKIVMGARRSSTECWRASQNERFNWRCHEAGGFWFINRFCSNVPGTYANTEEVIELSKVAAEYGGVYESHVRDESTYSIGVKGAIAELIEIGDKAKNPCTYCSYQGARRWCLGAK